MFVYRQIELATLVVVVLEIASKLAYKIYMQFHFKAFSLNCLGLQLMEIVCTIRVWFFSLVERNSVKS